jgi:glycosyltransferase involved in cell wall biosynthesis
MPENIKNISVLMPAYNCGKYIRTAINSILNQTFKDFEFIIIDDGSTDNTEELVSKIKDPRITYRKTENKGTSAALNYGISLAAYDWIARIDADDINVPERLEKQVKFIGSNPEYDVISSWSVYFRDPLKILFALKEPVEHNVIYEYLDLHNPMNQSATIYRKSIIEEAGYNENFKSNEDFELYYRIRDKSVFYNIPEFLVYTRVRSDSKTFSMSSGNIYDFLFPAAFKNMLEAKSKGDHFYWAGNIAWLNYFYGNRKDSRNFLKSSVSFKNFIAFLSTFLPQNSFNKLIDSRIKYRLKAVFSGTGTFKKELSKLLAQYA